MPQVTAAPMPITLQGREFRMAPLTDRDIDELNNWLRAEVIATARKAVEFIEDADARAEILGVALLSARALSWGEPKSHPFLESMDGKLRLMYQGLRRFHPALTFTEFKMLIRVPGDGALRPVDQAALDQLGMAWTELNLTQKHDSAGSENNGSGGIAAVEGEGVRPPGPAV